MPCERSLAHAPTCLGTTSRLVGDRTDWGKVSIADTRGNRLSNKLFYCFLSEAQEESHSVSAGNEVSQKHGFRKPSIASIALVSPSLILPLLMWNFPTRQMPDSHSALTPLECRRGGAFLSRKKSAPTPRQKKGIRRGKGLRHPPLPPDPQPHPLLSSLSNALRRPAAALAPG